jgi:hypothetical protein
MKRLSSMRTHAALASRRRSGSADGTPLNVTLQHSSPITASPSGSEDRREARQTFHDCGKVSSAEAAQVASVPAHISGLMAQVRGAARRGETGPELILEPATTVQGVSDGRPTSGRSRPSCGQPLGGR